ncbi:MAG: outer membrane beta-barrel protein [Bacteroidales bacterium]|nr:outer membrane beta-barrel protein [Bacteroidales bacterium]
MKNYLFLTFLFSLFSFPLVITAQQTTQSKEPRYAGSWQVGLTVGPDFYYGDLNKYKIGISKNVSFSGGFFAGYQLSNVFGLRGQILGGGLSGTKQIDIDSMVVNQKFKGGFVEINFNGTINFSNLISTYKPSRRFFIYGTLGIGFTNWRTTRSDQINGQSITTQDPVLWHSAVVVPFGLGTSFKIADKVNLGLEWTFRMVGSDLVDQTKGGFKFDFYDYLAVGVSFNIGQRSKTTKENVLDYYYTSAAAPKQPVIAPRLPEPQIAMISSPSEDYIYVVQIFAFDKHNYNPNWIRKKFHIDQPVTRERDGNLSRYIIGNFKDLSSAEALRDKMLKKGIHDAFVVAYKNGVRHHTVANGQ